MAMSLEAFTTEITDLMRERGYEVSVKEVIKNNDIRQTGIILMKGDEQVHPVLYLEGYHRRYRDGEDLEDLVEEMTSDYETARFDLDMGFFQEFDQVKERIYMRLVNYEKNKGLMKTVPHFRWLDLAVIFYYAMECPEGERASVTIRNTHLKMWEQTWDQIYQTAKENMERDIPGYLVPLNEIIEDLSGIGQPEDGHQLYVLTNREKIYGATAVIYSGKLEELAEKLQSDLLILPSSVHELLFLKDDHKLQYQAYRKIVEEINAAVVEPTEVLSDNIYRYDREKNLVKMIAA